MFTLNDIRNRSGLLILVIGVAMLGFILTDLMNSGTSLFQKSQNLLLKVNNKEVTFTNFEKELERSINIKFANNLGSVNISDVQRNNERDLLWDQKIEEILFEEKFVNSGIVVGDVESWDLISGELTGNQAQLFGYFFRDQTESGEWNQYNPEMIQSWIEMGTDNPQWFRYLFFRDNVIRERAFLKYYTAVKKGLYATDYNAKAYMNDQLQSSSGQYIYIQNNNEKLESELSNQEIKKYYKNNIEDFNNTPNREITYFIFNLKASNSDKNKIINEMESLISDRKVFNKRTNQEELDMGFKNTDDVESFINQYSDTKYQTTTIARLEFETSINQENIKNNIIQPYVDKNLCKMGRIISSTKDSITIAYLNRAIYASDQTLNEIYSNVYELINDNKKIDDIDVFAKENNLKPRQVLLEKMDESVPGLGSSRQIVRWAFNQETNLHTPSFFDLDDKYIITVLSNILEYEVKPLPLVEDDIKLILQNKQKSNLIANKLKNMNYTTLNEVAKNFNIKVKPIDALSMNSDVFGDEGYNPEMVGLFLGSENGNISEPQIIKNGVVIFQKLKEDPPKNSNFNSYKSIITNDYHSQVDLHLVETLKEGKNILDNRFNFY